MGAPGGPFAFSKPMTGFSFDSFWVRTTLSHIVTIRSPNLNSAKWLGARDMTMFRSHVSPYIIHLGIPMHTRGCNIVIKNRSRGRGLEAKPGRNPQGADGLRGAAAKVQRVCGAQPPGMHEIRGASPREHIPGVSGAASSGSSNISVNSKGEGEVEEHITYPIIYRHIPSYIVLYPIHLAYTPKYLHIPTYTLIYSHVPQNIHY